MYFSGILMIPCNFFKVSAKEIFLQGKFRIMQNEPGLLCVPF